MNIADIYRHIADGIETLEDSWQGYICDALESGNPEYTFGLEKVATVEDRLRALEFLRELGMRSGFFEFYLEHEPRGLDCLVDEMRFRRIVWLHFAADIAEEWGRK